MVSAAYMMYFPLPYAIVITVTLTI